MWLGLEAASPFRVLSAETYFDSVVVYELAHAAAEHTLRAGATSRADMEYIAYAMQIESLPAKARAALRAEWPVQVPVPQERMNDFVLSFVPHRFALLAWTHFDTEGNGCAFIEELLTGDATLALPALGIE